MFNVTNTDIKENQIYGNHQDSLSRYCYVFNFFKSNTINVIDNTFEKNNVTGVQTELCEQIVFKGNTFQNSTSYKGGGFTSEDSNFINISSNQFLNGYFATGYGAGLFIRCKALVDPLYLNITDNTFANNTAYVGAAITLWNLKYCEECKFSDLRMINNTSSTGGSGMYINILNNALFEDLDIQGNYCDLEGGGLVIVNSENLTVQNSILSNNKAVSAAGITLQDANGIKLINTDFINNSATSNYGAISFLNTENTTIQDCFFLNNSAQVSGALGLRSSQILSLKNLHFSDNKATEFSSVYIQKLNKGTLNNITIEKSHSVKQSSGIQLSDSENIDINIVEIIDNQSNSNNAGINIEQCKNLTINDIQIINNTAIQNFGAARIYLSQNIDIQNLYIKNCSAYQSHSGLFIEFSNEIIINNFTLQDNKADLFGGGISLSNLKNIKFYKGLIQNNTAQAGAAIFANKIQDINFLDFQVQNNTAHKQGGGILLQEAINTELKYFKIQHNKANIQGGGLSVRERSQIQIFHSIISQNEAYQYGSAIYSTESDSIILKNTSIYDNIRSQKGSGLYIFETQNLNIEQCLIYNHTSNKGSALFINGILQNLIISDTNIQNNTAHLQGGAIYFKNVNNFTIQNSNFSQNKILNQTDITQEIIQTQGGSIFGLTAKNMNILNTTLQNSSSFYQGGTLCLQGIDHLNIQDSKFLQNQVHFNQNIPLHEKNSTYILSQGGAIYLEYSQKQGQYSLSIQNSSFKNNKAQSGAGIFIHQKRDHLDIQYNIIQNNFTENIADLGQSARILGNITQESQSSIINSQNFHNNLGLLSEKEIFFGFFRNEKRLNLFTYQYSLCEKGAFIQNGGQHFCEKCIEHGQCNGGYIPIVPQKHYWRKNTDSLKFIKCELNPNACLGSDTCLEGHRGILCENCDITNNYYKDNQLNCLKCQENDQLFLYIFISFFLTTMLIFYQIIGMRNKVLQKILSLYLSQVWNYVVQKQTWLSGISKIIITHCQIIYLANTLNVKFPSLIFEGFSIIGNPSQNLSAKIQCFFTKNNSQDSIKTFTFKCAIFGMSLTLAVLFSLILISFLIFLVKKINLQQLKGYIISTALCFFITVQPGYLQNSLSFIMCRKIDSQFYSKADSNIDCESRYYKNTILPFNILIVILFSLIIPAFLLFQLIKMFKNPKKAVSISIQRAYGILFLEIKKQYYYWEIISLTLKIIIVFISINYEYQNVEKNSLICLIITIYGFYCFKIQPFIFTRLNNLQVFSSLVQMITILLSISINNNQTENNQDQSIIYIITFLIIFFNTLLGLQAIKMIYQEFGHIIRKIVLKNQKKSPKILLKYYKDVAQNEKSAKYRWIKIKLAIRRTIMLKKSYNFKNQFEQCLLEELSRFFNSKKIGHKQQYVSQKIMESLIPATMDQNYSLNSQRLDEIFMKQGKQQSESKVFYLPTQTTNTFTSSTQNNFHNSNSIINNNKQSILSSMGANFSNIRKQLTNNNNKGSYGNINTQNLAQLQYTESSLLPSTNRLALINEEQINHSNNNNYNQTDDDNNYSKSFRNNNNNANQSFGNSIIEDQQISSTENIKSDHSFLTQPMDRQDRSDIQMLPQNKIINFLQQNINNKDNVFENNNVNFSYSDITENNQKNIQEFSEYVLKTNRLTQQ